MSLALTIDADALIILSECARKAIGGLLQEEAQGIREKTLTNKRDSLTKAMIALRVATISENNESIIEAGIEMEKLRQAAASYGGFLDNLLSAECSQAMADALAMLRFND